MRENLLQEGTKSPEEATKICITFESTREHNRTKCNNVGSQDLPENVFASALLWHVMGPLPTLHS